MSTTPSTLTWESRPFSELIRLALPTVLSLVSLSVMTLVDTLFIGRLGAVPLAASGLGGVCVFTVVSFGLAVLSTAKVKVGQHHGANHHSALKRSLGAMLKLSFGLGSASALVGLAAAYTLPFLSADEPTGALAKEYAAIRSLGFPCVLVSTAIGSWLQAQGDSKSAMTAALVANLINVPLNLIFVFSLDWGVQGAALATVGSRIVEALCLIAQQKTQSIQLNPRQATAPGFHLAEATWRDAWQTLLVGLPTGLERVLDMLAFAAVPVLLSQMGPVHVAAHQIVLQLMFFSFLPLFALNESVSVLIAQAVGATRMGLVRQLSNLGLAAAVTYAALYGVLCLILSSDLVSIFTPDQTVVEVGRATLVLGALLQFLNAIYTHFKAVLRGLSVFRFVAWVTVGCAWMITPPLTYFFGVHAGQGAPGAWKALCIEVTVGVFLLLWKVRRPI